jgi:hypothetical protein
MNIALRKRLPQDVAWHGRNKQLRSQRGHPKTAKALGTRETVIKKYSLH